MKLPLTLASALALASAVTPAEAALTTLTVTGTIKDGKVCNAPGVCTDLTGQGYKTVYTIDDSIGRRSTQAGLYDTLQGGTSVFMTPPTPVTAKATIAGQTYTSLGLYLGYLTTQSAAENGTVNDLKFIRAAEQVIDNPGNPAFYHRNEFTSQIYYAASPNDPMILDPITGLSSSSVGQIFLSDFTRDLGTGHYTSYFYLLANSDIATAVFNLDDGTGTGTVPEPASWTLMIAGFGLVGTALRRRGTRASSLRFASA